MEKAVNKFLQLLEKQEKKGFKDLATLLSHLPKPAQGSARSISVAEAMETGFFSALDEVQSDMFTLSQLLLYQDAHYQSWISWVIPVYLVYPWLTHVVLISKVIQFSGGQWRFEEESRDPQQQRGSQALR